MIDLGERGTGPFSAEVTGLSQPNVYYFRAYALNSGGASWTATAGTFNSKPLPHSRPFGCVVPLQSKWG